MDPRLARVMQMNVTKRMTEQFEGGDEKNLTRVPRVNLRQRMALSLLRMAFSLEPTLAKSLSVRQASYLVQE